MDILQIHNTLNNIYEKAENFNKKLNELKYKTLLKSYNNHFISINGNYYKQKYFMPVISIEDKGDICFNIDSIEFEFYVTKDEILDIDLDKLISDFKERLNIYEYNNCTNDIYQVGNNKDKVLDKINNSLDNKFGISIDCSSLSDIEIIKFFITVCSLLNKNF